MVEELVVGTSKFFVSRKCLVCESCRDRRRMPTKRHEGEGMKSILMLAAILFVSPLQAQTSPDEKSIRNILNEEVSTWNAGDAVGYSRHFTEDCTFTNIRGMFFKGQKAFEQRQVEIFRGEFHGTALHQEVASIQFLRPDVAIVETLTTVSNFPGPVPPESTLTKTEPFTPACYKYSSNPTAIGKSQPTITSTSRAPHRSDIRQRSE
jgi:uncharacterized protein (TIGR02246 family)